MSYHRHDKILNLYLTAGYPDSRTSRSLVQALLDHPAVDMIELGMPFSDPLADGPVIQHTSQVALAAGMTMERYFQLVASVENHRNIPMIFMGYFNNVLQYGVERFIRQCTAHGIDSSILPDLPPEVYLREYQSLFESSGLGLNFLVTPQSSDETIRRSDQLCRRFIYLVSSGSTTGSAIADQHRMEAYLQRIEGMRLSSLRLVGFGISSHAHYQAACRLADGAIVGSALMQHLTETNFDLTALAQFIQTIRYDHST
ncbi:MAG: tryptophan synthase subunit alpha [Saprospiraceae bacterium]|nr:tryptophan synthase subunit alpha [Saprospiraceae bacterium]